MTPDPFGTRLLEGVRPPVDTDAALIRVLTRYRRRRLFASLASAVVLLTGTAALRWTLVSDDGTPLRTVDRPSTTTTQPGSSVSDCSASSDIPLYAGQYSLARTPDGYYSAGSTVTYASGPIDLGGVDRTELRLRSGTGAEIDLTSIGAERPLVVIAEDEADSTTSTTTVSPCVRLDGGAERVPIEATVFAATDHIAIGWQVWEYGGFKLTGRNGVTVAELVDIANSLVESPPGPTGGVRHTVPTHCGVLSTVFEGQLWIAVPARPDGFGDPLDGWDENDTPGWLIVSGSEAEFIADSGATAQFRRAQPDEANPQAGCE